MSPLCKARTCPRTPNFVLLKESSSGKQFTNELAARAEALAV
jgi:hypothetical protein